ncbi:altronate dehydratase family protein [Mucilaginibacter sabulilitoris]|uniref:Altronate dehydratase family protein n=1 Tax=Mucilaginibacter sabulilitoris TaxID=1173583 RepID=A0ABZ0TSG4_9SPHI|nr:altronate dehydratase family protein [Mucilaginibacter sabulilitoris]WPU96058.1 altronate dehydratase family protein [Mucilaginibacter sabulilitoris]
MSAQKETFLRIHPHDNVLVALQDLEQGTVINFEGNTFTLVDRIAAKHKFAINELKTGQEIYMYGVLVGKTTSTIPRGGLLSTQNVHHASDGFHLGERKLNWHQPDTANFESKTFNGYHRADGSVGTANYWIVVPLVFCENRNINVLKEALVDKLGYKKAKSYEGDVEQLVELYQAGKSVEEILNADIQASAEKADSKRLFKNIDGIKFLNHSMGCGGTKDDSDALCGLIAGYITHPNVAGATVLSLGCQHAQVSILQAEIAKRDPSFNKPMVVLEQQKVGTESELLKQALKQTFAGLVQANQNQRQPAPLSKLCIGMECGGSDGFSGISANPALGYVSDLLVTMGGSVILAEFPELCGVEQELSDRCIDEETANRFMHLMTTYNAKAEADGSGFYANPSPGNIRDGLITDAIKSAGAAKKGGNSPVAAVLDYPEKVTKPGLNLLCTPGSDVESTTAEVGSGANIVLFTTGLGTPTGNPITPVVKLSTNTAMFERMPDIIDINCGTIIEGSETIQQAGERILNYVIQLASGEVEPKAVKLGQDDFIPWKRGVSL